MVTYSAKICVIYKSDSVQGSTIAIIIWCNSYDL